MKTTYTGHSADLINEVIHKEIIVHSDKPKICKAQRGLTGSSKRDIIRADNSSTSYSCSRGFCLHPTTRELGPKHWSDYHDRFNHCPHLLPVFSFQICLLRNLGTLFMGELLSLGPPSQLALSVTALLGLWFLLLPFPIFT